MFLTSTGLAKRAMKLRERHPKPDELGLGEIFETEEFRSASPEQRGAVMRASSEFRISHEAALPFGRHFDVSLRPFLEGKDVLDLGCFTGGRSIAWAIEYKVRKSYGCDISPVYIEAAAQSCRERGIDAEFKVGFGEELPFPDAVVDAIVSYDVLEHVRDVDLTLRECARVLRPGGVLIAVFPPFYNPTEHHLSMVTRTPALHWLFTPATLFRAYRELIAERGPGASWYAVGYKALRSWEKLYTLNGITVGRFQRIVNAQGWDKLYFGLPVWASTTGPLYRRPKLRSLLRVADAFNAVPGLRELLTDRICVVLRRPSNGTTASAPGRSARQPSSASAT